MLIVEGPDGAGKTTLINKLVETHGFKLLPRACTSEGGPVPNLAEWTSAELSKWPISGIYDRFPLFSDSVYGPIVRGYPTPAFADPINWPHLMGKFWTYFPALIFCLPPLQTVRANLSQDKQMAGVEKNIDAIYWGYFYQAHAYSLLPGLPGVLIYDYENDHISKVHQYVQGYLSAHPYRRPQR